MRDSSISIPSTAAPFIAAASGCASQNGNCWVDEKRFQWHLTGLLSMTPSGTGAGLLKLLGADTATVTGAQVLVDPHAHRANATGGL